MTRERGTAISAGLITEIIKMLWGKRIGASVQHFHMKKTGRIVAGIIEAVFFAGLTGFVHRYP